MKIREKLKRIKWLINNQEKLKELIPLMEEMKKPISKKDTFSIEGVPEFQKDYVASIMKGLEK